MSHVLLPDVALLNHYVGGRRQWPAQCLMTQGVPSLSLSWSLLLFLQGTRTIAIQTNEPRSLLKNYAINISACHLA